MTTWAELGAAALLGTARREVDLAGLPGALGAAADAPGDPAARLLDAAALATAYRRAGARPVAPDAPDADVPGPVGPESGRLVTPAAAGHLALVLGASELLLVEWAGHAAAGGWRPPAEALPELLDAAAGDPAVADAVRPLLGERGRWLAALRPEWSGLLAPAAVDPAVWEHGDRDQRRALFTAGPGRERLRATWKSESGEDREWFLDRIAADPVDADEPLLETALDDRRKGVRERAADALARLPRSAYGTRMAGRARAAITVERRLLRTRMVVAPPTDLDAGLARDGIRPTPPTGTGQQTWWLRQIVAGAPLATWAELGTPAELLGWTPADWRAALYAGWQQAAIRQRDPAWAAALLDRMPEREVAGLLAVLPPERRAAAVTKPLTGWSIWTLPTILRGVPGPWPDELAVAVLARLVRPDTRPREAREVLGLLGARLPPGRAPSVRDRAAAARGTDWGPALDAVADTLTFRHAMLEELR